MNRNAKHTSQEQVQLQRMLAAQEEWERLSTRRPAPAVFGTLEVAR